VQAGRAEPAIELGGVEFHVAEIVREWRLADEVVHCRQSLAAPLIGALRGYVDVVRPTRIAGWAQNLEHPEAPVCLDIYADGVLIGRTLAGAYREDLELAGIGSGRHGFEFVRPKGTALRLDAIEVRRSLDKAMLELSHAARAALRPSARRGRRAR
jgi:hypothetical protein